MSTTLFKPILLDLLQQSQRDEEAFWQTLSDAELNAVGTPQLWSAKDHIAHRTFWHQELIRKIAAIRQQQVVSSNESSDDEINAITFEKNKLRPWQEVRAESEQTHAELIALLEQLSEEELADTERFTAIAGGRPLYTSFLGGCYEHDQEHLAQYYTDRDALVQATEIRERCVNRVVQSAVPEWVKGWFLYNLACFYAKINSLEKADTLLQESLAFAPELTEHSKSDPDLAALRSRSV